MKKAMKKLGLSLCLLASLGLAAGCGNNADTKQGQTAAPQETQEADKTINLGILQFADHASLDNCRIGFIEGLKQGGY